MLRSLFLAAAFAVSAPAIAQDALVISTLDLYGQDVQTTLLGTGAFASVDFWQGNVGTPTLLDLANYEVVYLEYDAVYANTIAMGDVLADYVDGGGGVVAPVFDWAFPGVQGRLASGGYFGFEPASVQYVDDRLATNTGGFSGAYLSGAFNVQAPVLAAGATLLATYDDGDGFIATKSTGNGTVVSVNDYNVSNAVGRTDFWDLNYDGAQLWANVGLYAAGTFVGGFDTAATGTCGGPVTISVSGGTPGGQLGYVTGTPGASVIPVGVCAGTPLPVANPRLRAQRIANGNGGDLINIPALAPQFCGQTYVVVDIGTCDVAVGTLP